MASLLDQNYELSGSLNECQKMNEGKPMNASKEGQKAIDHDKQKWR